MSHLGGALAILHDLGRHRDEGGRVGFGHLPGPRAHGAQPLLLLHKARHRVPGLQQPPTSLESKLSWSRIACKVRSDMSRIKRGYSYVSIMPLDE